MNINTDELATRTRLLNFMMKKLDEQIAADSVSTEPGHQYILEDFTNDELRMVRLFVHSFKGVTD